LSVTSAPSVSKEGERGRGRGWSFGNDRCIGYNWSISGWSFGNDRCIGYNWSISGWSFGNDRCIGYNWSISGWCISGWSISDWCVGGWGFLSSNGVTNYVICSTRTAHNGVVLQLTSVIGVDKFKSLFCDRIRG
jgi:hypothetical protein